MSAVRDQVTIVRVRAGPRKLNLKPFSMNALKKLQEISNNLKPHGIVAPTKEAELLLRAALQTDLTHLYRDNPDLTGEQNAIIDRLVARRMKREPLQYVLGYTDFFDLRLFVGQGVLIPRPETELMAEYAIELLKKERVEGRNNLPLSPSEKEAGVEYEDRERRSPIMILDLCTGSGCLALALARTVPGSHVYGTDVSEIALGYARKNADANNIKNASFLLGHLFDPVSSEIPEPLFDLIISNPPYIRTDEIENLQPEISTWEPVPALDGGADGLCYYREIIPSARKFLKKNGLLVLELGGGAAAYIAAMLHEEGYTRIEIRKDYAGIERMISAFQ